MKIEIIAKGFWHAASTVLLVVSTGSQTPWDEETSKVIYTKHYYGVTGALPRLVGYHGKPVNYCKCLVMIWKQPKRLWDSKNRNVAGKDTN